MLLSIANVLVNNPSTDTTQNTQSETTMVVFGSTVLVGFNDSGNYVGGTSNHFTGWSRSTDGGGTFTDLGSLPGNDDFGDPSLARNNTTGTVFFATLNGSGSQLNVFRSTNGGASFGSAVNGSPGSGQDMDKEWLGVDNFAGAGNGNVYLVGRDFGASDSIKLWKSTNDGLSFGPSGGVTIVTGLSNQGAQVAVGPDHSVYVFWFESSGGQRLRVRRSTDFGVTFGASFTVATLSTTGVNGDLGLGGFRSSAFCQAAVNPITGAVYVVYPDNPAGTDRADVFFRQSTDGGATWSSALRVNDDAGLNDQWEPALAVTPNGAKVGVFWYDRRLDAANNLMDRYGAIGTVSGGTVTFPVGGNQRISTVSFAPIFGADPVINPTYMGDYDVAVADNSFFYTTWGDNRTASQGPNVMFAKVPLEVAGPSVIALSPTGNVYAPVTSPLRVTFDEAIDTTTFDPSDIVSFTGPGGAIISVTAVDLVVGSLNTQFDLTFGSSPLAATGTYTLVLGPHIKDTVGAGREMDQNGNLTPGEDPGDRFTGTFGIRGPRVIASTPSSGTFAPVATVRVTFDEAMNADTFVMLDDIVSFTGPGGAIAVTSVTPVSGSTTYFDINFAPQTAEGDYTLVLGPDIRDTFNNQMDQNGNLVPGEAGDQFTAAFTILGPVGPDGFGYTASPYTFESIDLVSGQTGVFTILSGADDDSVAVDLGGNTFSFYGVSYTGLFASSNGIITFGTANADFTNTDLTDYPSEPTIAVLWDDWYPAGAPMILGKFEGLGDLDPTNDQLIIEWNGIQGFSSSPSQVTFQAILQLNTGADAFVFNYPDLDSGDFRADGGSATVGIKDAGAQGANRLLVSLDGALSPLNPYVGTGQALRFTEAMAGPVVVSSSPTGIPSAPVSSVRVTFSRPINPDTFQLAQADIFSFTRNGTDVSSSLLAITPVDGSGNTQFDITFTAQNATGAYSMVLGPDIRDTSGNQMDQDHNGTPGQATDRYTATFAIRGPRIVASTPSGTVNTAVSSVRVTFDEAMNPDTFLLAQGDIFTFTRTVGATVTNLSSTLLGITPVTGSGNTQFDITFVSQTVTGAYSMVLGPDIRDTFGNQMDQNGNFIPGESGDRYTASFSISGPRIIANTPSGNVKGTVKSVRVTFDRPMVLGTFTTADIVSFTGPGGAIAVKSVSVVAGSNNTQFTITFANQSVKGTYTMVLGPDIRDTLGLGNQMDQNGNLVPGEVPGDRFTATFAIAKGTASPGNGPAGGDSEAESGLATAGGARAAELGGGGTLAGRTDVDGAIALFSSSASQPLIQAPGPPIFPAGSPPRLLDAAIVDWLFAAAGKKNQEAVFTTAKPGSAAAGDGWWADLFPRDPLRLPT